MNIPLKKKYRAYGDDHTINRDGTQGKVKSRMWNVSHFGAGNDRIGRIGGTKGKNWPRGLSGRTTSKKGSVR